MRTRRGASIDVGLLLERLGIKAEQRGRSWWACCPFHEEKTPSWRMRDEPGHEAHGLHHCFGCEEGGSAGYLVMRMLGIEEPRDAWLWINSDDKADRELLPAVQIEVADPRLKVFRLPPGVVIPDALSKWPEIARSFAAQRGLEPWQIERWRLGFAREGRLRGRLVIPVRNRDGKLLGYTGRAWARTASKKYKEPREEEGADPGAVFGEEWWPHFRSGQRVVLCEGALNALAIERVFRGGFVAALMGSHFDQAHAAKLTGFAEVVIASDPDTAGAKMREAMKGIARWMRLRHAHFPKGTDACDVEKEEGPEALKQIVERAA